MTPDNTPLEMQNPAGRPGFAENTRREQDSPSMPLAAASVNAAVDEVETSADAQRKRLLEVLRKRSVSTLEARRELDVLHPAGRIMELRKLGHDIQTVGVVEVTSEGRAHHVARYILRRTASEARE